MLINLMTDTGPLDVSGYASLHKHALRRGERCLSKDRVIRLCSVKTRGLKVEGHVQVPGLCFRGVVYIM